MRLIKNEVMKIFAQKKMYVFGVIIFGWVAFTTLVSYIGIINSGVNGQSLAFDNLSLMVDFLYPILVIILLAELVTEELTQETFTLTLVHPVSRQRYLAAKVGAVAFLLMLLMVFSIILHYVAGTVAFGWGESFQLGEMKISVLQGISWTLIAHVIALIAIMAFGMVVLLLALVLESSGAVVGAAVGIFFVLNIVRLFVPDLRVIIIHTYFRFYEFLFGGLEIKQIIAGICIILLYGLGSYLLAVKLIKRRDFT